MSTVVSIAVAGAGLIGQAHIKRILAQPEARLCAIIDPSPAARAQAEALGVPYFSDLDEALTKVRPDGVVLATPNQLHVPGGLSAVKHGVPALVEKPISGDVASAMQLVTASEAADVPILVGHHHRHSPLIAGAREIVRSGQLGRMVAAHGFYWFRKPDTGYFDGPGAWRRGPGGGPILINLIHMIDDFRNICGDIVRVQAAQSSATRGFDVEDTAAMILHFANGALGTLGLSDTAASPWSWELTSGENKAYPQTDQPCMMVTGTVGSLSLPRLQVWRYPDEPHWFKPIDMAQSVRPEADPLDLQMAHFCKVIRREVKPIIDAREGTRTLETTLAVKQAAESGLAVDLS